ncbi:hypothetical protein [Kiloniella sp.]|uniref:hypothetical protein n=1 Tax=Kiloniella sp. TaxID=1938587 RepID=UPI003B01B3DD
MQFNRRELMTSLIALTFTSYCPPSFAEIKQEGHKQDQDRDGKDLGEDWSNPGFLRLRTITTIIQINNIIMITALAIYFMRFITLGNQLKRQNENRVTIPKSVPLLGSLFKESYEADDFAASKKMGLAYTYDNSLILDLVPNRPQIGEDNHPDLNLDTTITDLDRIFPSVGKNFALKIGTNSYSSERVDLLNDDYSYRMPTMEIKAVSGDKHPLTFMNNIPLTSSLFKNRVGEVYGARNLHILVRPSIVADY